MKVSNGDVLEVYEESDADDQEHEDSEDEQPHGRNFKAVLADTVALHSEPSEKAKKRHVLRKKKKLTKSQLSEKRKLTQQRKLLGLVRPDVTTNREKERLLKKIATKGVVQLFNAVAERQRILAEELSKKMSAKQRRETEKRLDGPTAFHIYPENRKEDLKKEAKEEEDDDDCVKTENEEE